MTTERKHLSGSEGRTKNTIQSLVENLLGGGGIFNLTEVILGMRLQNSMFPKICEHVKIK
jgi:hypothetical protein